MRCGRSALELEVLSRRLPILQKQMLLRGIALVDDEELLVIGRATLLEELVLPMRCRGLLLEEMRITRTRSRDEENREDAEGEEVAHVEAVRCCC